ncbi:MAG: RHS repeat-associated core domain-containing protein [Syntrophomonadaceae bacterium]|nr:RHS repeat-associated core domain-containing protein [Syntrophomonadaceae bacterium]
MYTYDAFGNMIAQTGTTPNDYLFTGEQYDPNIGFYYLRARYMNPNTGRFLTMDTYEGSPFDPMSLHKYLYANASPLMYTDASGAFSLAEMTATFSIYEMLQSSAYGMVTCVLFKSVQLCINSTIYGKDYTLQEVAKEILIAAGVGALGGAAGYIVKFWLASIMKLNSDLFISMSRQGAVGFFSQLSKEFCDWAIFKKDITWTDAIGRSITAGFAGFCLGGVIARIDNLVPGSICCPITFSGLKLWASRLSGRLIEKMIRESVRNYIWLFNADPFPEPTN